MLGVTGGGASTTTVLLTGLAGLLSGALSMGAGEYVSVRSQRELLAASAPDISDAHTVLPALDLDANELALVYRARGVPADEARSAPTPCCAATTRPGRWPRSRTRATATRSWAPGSAPRCRASRSSPPAPRCPSCRSCSGSRASTALVIAAVLVGLALMLTGATVGVLSGGPPLRRAVRQLAIGAGAAAVTYGLGLLFGATLG